MKTFNHTVSFPSAVGELIVQYNFTEAGATLKEKGYAWLAGKEAGNKPAEVEITDVWVELDSTGFSLSNLSYKKCLTEYGPFKQAVYEAHMKQLKEKEDAEAERKDGYSAPQIQAKVSPDDVACYDEWKCIYPHCYCPAKEQPRKTSTLHEHAKQMWELGQELLGLKQNPLRPDECTKELELTITEPEYPYSAEQPNTVQQKGIYIQMPDGIPLPDHILQIGDHLEQPPIKDIQDYI